MNIYDYAFDLAVANSDADFLAFLDEYTVVFVQLRLVSSFVDEIESEINQNAGHNLPKQSQLSNILRTKISDDNKRIMWYIVIQFCSA